jgi:hypothetical protein
VGVISIVLGSLGLLTSCLNIFSGMFMQAFNPATMGAMMAQAQAQAQARRSVPFERMPRPRRQAVVATFDQINSISAPRREMFDQLLADVGDDMFPFSSDQTNSQRLRSIVTKSGEYPGTGGTTGNSYFVLTTGRIELADDHALFSPSSGGGTVRVYRDRSNAGTTGTPGQSTTLPATLPIMFGAAKTPSPIASYVVAMAANLVIAGFLLVSGIVVFTRSRRPRRLHLIYAALKIPLAICAGIVAMQMTAWWMSMIRVSGGPPMPNASILGIFSGGMTTVLACIYPVALLIVMNVRSVKDFYAAESPR